MGVLGDRRLRRASRDEQLSVVDHLDELRNRLIVAGLALVVAFAAAYAFHEQLIAFLEEPLPQRFEDTGLITLSPTEPFFTTLKVCFWAAILAAVPIWLYQVYAFVIPAVQDQSRRRMLAIVAGASSLFVAGVAFGYWVVLPVALDFLLNFGGDTFQTQVRAGEYFGFVTTLMFASGLMFEVPVAMVALARIGVASADLYIKQWRIALVVIAALAAVLPGGDPFSMLLLM
ncbi:MAG TPA: twin-arginine translocase subunit TatC, partial [Gemmatimonadaceae bacterium]|nr:twin-arginine translocase subunit TatC [Gemmatimonadaceae bacterium]